jgi:hypothetical protein
MTPVRDRALRGGSPSHNRHAQKLNKYTASSDATAEYKFDNVTVIVEETQESPLGMAPRHHVGADTLEDFVRKAFDHVIEEAGEKHGRALWATSSRRGRGRPKGPRTVIIENTVVSLRGIAPRHYVLTDTLEDFVREAFDHVVAEVGDKHGRELWASTRRRGRGRPKGPKYNFILIVPLIRSVKRKIPAASKTAIATAVIDELERYGNRQRFGNSRVAAIKNLVAKLA